MTTEEADHLVASTWRESWRWILFTAIRPVVRDSADCEDILADTFLDLVPRVRSNQIERPGSLRYYAWKCARYRAYRSIAQLKQNFLISWDDTPEPVEPRTPVDTQRFIQASIERVLLSMTPLYSTLLSAELERDSGAAMAFGLSPKRHAHARAAAVTEFRSTWCALCGEDGPLTVAMCNHAVRMILGST